MTWPCMGWARRFGAQFTHSQVRMNLKEAKR
jgi:hypothetical protein